MQAESSENIVAQADIKQGESTTIMHKSFVIYLRRKRLQNARGTPVVFFPEGQWLSVSFGLSYTPIGCRFHHPEKAILHSQPIPQEIHDNVRGVSDLAFWASLFQAA